ncbi:NEAT domain-containing protein [Terrisporobacter sp.]|uniref:NEAT domain-containing protein n=1 Tax=Terrisporobacter sp. TaxID=1965305 RepID=UPI002A82D894|nr:NEAT domain-containing protein [Terrisporobacter sp.]MDY4735233.1 NEAT domain-containing protein [Terrisporobacter sp.]
MIRKGKLVKNTAIALAIISVFGSTLSSVSAAELIKSTPAITQYVDGTYKVDAKLIKDTSDEDSMANGYLKSTNIQISKGKMYMIMEFTSGNLLKEINPSVNGKSVEKTITNNGDIKTVKFELTSLDDKVELGVLINPFGDFTVNAACRVKIENAQIPTTPEKEEDDAVTSPTPSLPNEDDKNEVVEENEQALNTVLKHETQDKDSSANRYLESSKLKIVDGKKYIVLNFNSGSMFTAMKASISGKEVETKFEYYEKSDIATVEFEISSLQDDMLLSFTYNTPMGSMTHSARIQSEIASTGDKDDAVVPPTADKEDNVTPPTTDKEEDKTDSDNSNKDLESTSNSTYKNGYYQLNNKVECDNAVGYQMVRNLLSETTNMEVKNGKTYVTLRMSSYSLMSNITMKVNNKSVNFTKNVIDKDTVELTVEVPNVNAKITMGMYVNAMGQTVSFGVTFDKDSLKFISSNEEPTIPDSNNESINNSVTNNSTNDESTDTTNESINTTVENNVVKGKLYTIKNEVISDSATGKAMARKYLNSTTKIEEVDGKMYATLTFTGVDLMSNHKIYVNGSVVNHTITSKTSSSVSIRFAIPNVNADIKVQVFVVPMNSTVTFGVKLLEDTLTFVKDFEVENGSLPQTGSAFGSEMLLGLGGLLTASGALLRRKRK